MRGRNAVHYRAVRVYRLESVRLGLGMRVHRPGVFPDDLGKVISNRAGQSLFEIFERKSFNALGIREAARPKGLDDRDTYLVGLDVQSEFGYSLNALQPLGELALFGRVAGNDSHQGLGQFGRIPFVERKAVVVCDQSIQW